MHRCYSVFDRKSLQYWPPYFCATDGAATRMLSDLVSDVDTNVGRHPADYVLFYVGSYDDAKGRMEAVSPLVHVVDAIALVRAAPELPLAPVRSDLGRMVPRNGSVATEFDTDEGGV